VQGTFVGFERYGQSLAKPDPPSLRLPSSFKLRRDKSAGQEATPGRGDRIQNTV